MVIDTHDGEEKKPKKYQVKEDREDIHKLVQEAIYGPAVPDPLQTPTTSVYVPDYELAERLADFEGQFEDDEEAMTLLLLA